MDLQSIMGPERLEFWWVFLHKRSTFSILIFCNGKKSRWQKQKPHNGDKLARIVFDFVICSCVYVQKQIFFRREKRLFRAGLFLFSVFKLHPGFCGCFFFPPLVLTFLEGRAFARSIWGDKLSKCASVALAPPPKSLASSSLKWLPATLYWATSVKKKHLFSYFFLYTAVLLIRAPQSWENSSISLVFSFAFNYYLHYRSLLKQLKLWINFP